MWEHHAVGMLIFLGEKEEVRYEKIDGAKHTEILGKVDRGWQRLESSISINICIIL